LAAVSAVEILFGSAIALIGESGGPEFVVITTFGRALISLIGLGTKVRDVILAEMADLPS
jgi:hypothetical protein